MYISLHCLEHIVQNLLSIYNVKQSTVFDANFTINKSSFFLGIFTRDVTASSQDYQPLSEALNEDVVFEPNEHSKEVVITITNDGLFEPPETFEVFLKNNIEEYLRFPRRAVVTIQSDDSKCYNKSFSDHFF